MAVEFIPDIGFRLSHEGRSLILSAMAFLKPGESLTDCQKWDFGSITDDYTDEIRGLRPSRVTMLRLANSSCELTNDVAYKFTDEVAVGFWMKGSIRLRPVASYHSIENIHARDPREGVAHVYLRGQARDAQFRASSGFNSVVVCTSSDARKSERRYRQSRFGPRLLRINGVREFAKRLAENLGTAKYAVRDVVYSDVKLVDAANQHVDAWAEMQGNSDLAKEWLHHVADNHLDELIDVSAAAAVFSKPNRHRLERERRFHFLLQQDRDNYIDVVDPLLAEHIEVIV